MLEKRIEAVDGVVQYLDAKVWGAHKCGASVHGKTAPQHTSSEMTYEESKDPCTPTHFYTCPSHLPSRLSAPAAHVRRDDL